jgi:hypothetical protein
MTRPLLITDCDEVLLHMVAHFEEWLDEVHGIDFHLENGDFATALTDRATGAPVPKEDIWPLLGGFFSTEMHRQTLVPGAAEALARIGEIADIVILTNLNNEAHGWRVEQLAGHGINHQVVCNQGGKGVPVKTLLEERAEAPVVFVDDLPVHHASVAKHAPHVWRLHMVAEPRLAPNVPPSVDAHARIDDWPTATDWILDRLMERA